MQLLSSGWYLIWHASLDVSCKPSAKSSMSSSSSEIGGKAENTSSVKIQWHVLHMASPSHAHSKSTPASIAASCKCSPGLNETSNSSLSPSIIVNLIASPADEAFRFDSARRLETALGRTKRFANTQRLENMRMMERGREENKDEWNNTGYYKKLLNLYDDDSDRRHNLNGRY